MTTEERLDRLEEVSEKLTELTMTVAGTAQRQQEQLERHQKMLGDIVSILQRQQKQLDDIVGIIERQQEQLAHQQELLDEVRQDTKMTRRLWVRLATKHGWLDEDDLNGDGA
jgi:ABC-type transporter Mla subunit MlaD